VFGDLYDKLSMIFSWRWPTAEGVITAVRVDPCRQGLQVVLDYEFALDDGQPYTGESSAPSWVRGSKLINVHETFRVGNAVTVRYRTSDPSVNRLDGRVWRDFEDAL
jgi:hypothetical protein